MLDPADFGPVMPDFSVKYVELVCVVSTGGFLAAASYNVLLLILCLLISAKIRKLTINYNEPRFIGMRLYTDVIMWLAIFPAYFLSNQGWYQSMLQALALIIHSTVWWMFAFVSTLYAIRFIPVAKLDIINLD